MILKINTNSEAIEKVNYLLAQSLQQLIDKPSVAEAMDISPYDIHIMMTFRKQMLKGYFSYCKIIQKRNRKKKP